MTITSPSRRSLRGLLRMTILPNVMTILRHHETRPRARLQGRKAPMPAQPPPHRCYSSALNPRGMGRVNLLRAVALSSALVIAGGAFAGELADPAGPPLSAAPPRAPPPRPYPSPPRTPRSAEADAAAYE